MLYVKLLLVLKPQGYRLMTNQTHTEPNRHWLTFPLLLATYEIVTYLSTDAYLPALTHLAQAFNTTQSMVQLTLSIWFMGSATLQLLLGPLSERFGRRRILLIGGGCYVIASLGCAWATQLPLFLLARFLQGATIASMTVAGYATLHDALDRAQAIQALAIMGAITIIAPALGPLLGAALLQFATWRDLFILLALAALPVLIGLYYTMPETARAMAEPLNLKQCLTDYRQLLGQRRFIRLTLCGRFLLAALIAWLTIGPSVVIERFARPPTTFAWAQCAIFSCFMLCTYAVKPLMTRFALTHLTRIGLGLAASSTILGCITAFIWPQVLWPSIVAMVGLAGGAGCAFPILGRLAIEASDIPMGSRVAMTSFTTGLFGVLGSLWITLCFQGHLLSMQLALAALTAAALVYYSFTPAEAPDAKLSNT